MKPINFHTTNHIICEPNGLQNHLGKIANNFAAQSAIIITDKILTELGFVDIAVASLQEFGIKVVIFDGVKPDPPIKIVDEAIVLARENQCDLVIGLGGGSTIDTAKLIALHNNNFDQLESLFDQDLTHFDKLPLIAIPTTAGTGAEVTFVSVITDKHSNKFAFYTPKILPDVAILDANLTLNLPKHITSATALDAMVHCIEAYTSRSKKNPISDALAIKGLTLLWHNYSIVLKQGNNIEARSNMLLGACLAGMAFVNASVAAVHGLSYPLSIRYGLSHGHANAVVMCPVFNFNQQVATQEYAQLARYVMPQTQLLSDKEASQTFIDELQEFLLHSGLIYRLSELGVKANEIDDLSEMMVNTYSRLIATNPCDMTVDDVKQMYQSVF